MDNQSNAQNYTPPVQKKKSNAELFSYIAIGLPALYLVLEIIETVFFFVSSIPIVSYLILPIDFLISPFVDLGQFLTIFLSPVIAIAALIMNISNKKRVMSQESPDAADVASAKKGILLSVIATIAAFVIFIYETIKTIVSIIVLALVLAFVVFIVVIPYLLPYILPLLI